MIKLNVKYPTDNNFKGYAELIYLELNDLSTFQNENIYSDIREHPECASPEQRSLFFCLAYYYHTQNDGHYYFYSDASDSILHVIDGLKLLSSVLKDSVPKVGDYSIEDYLKNFENGLSHFPNWEQSRDINAIEHPVGIVNWNEFEEQFKIQENVFAKLDSLFPFTGLFDLFVEKYPDKFLTK